MKGVNSQNKNAFLAMLGLLSVFTLLFLAHYLNQWGYITLFLALLLASFAVLFSERVKEMYLGRFVLKLYRKSEEGLSFNKIAMSITQILIKLSEHTPGSAKQRKEREVMINELLVSLRADQKMRRSLMKNSKLITKLMATDDEAELEKIREQIDKAGLFN